MFFWQANQAKRDAYWRAMRVKIFIAVVILLFILSAVFILWGDLCEGGSFRPVYFEWLIDNNKTPYIVFQELIFLCIFSVLRILNMCCLFIVNPLNIFSSYNKQSPSKINVFSSWLLCQQEYSKYSRGSKNMHFFFHIFY